MEIKPFCVKSSDLNSNELNIILEKCVRMGAAPCHWHQERINDHEVYIYEKDKFEYWGVAVDFCTTTSDRYESYDKNLLSKEDALTMLGVDIKENQYKPDWKYSPIWAKYLAMNADGHWFWYEEMPRIALEKKWSAIGCKSEQAFPHDRAWKASLETRPE